MYNSLLRTICKIRENESDRLIFTKKTWFRGNFTISLWLNRTLSSHIGRIERRQWRWRCRWCSCTWRNLCRFVEPCASLLLSVRLIDEFDLFFQSALTYGFPMFWWCSEIWNQNEKFNWLLNYTFEFTVQFSNKLFRPCSSSFIYKLTRIRMYLSWRTSRVMGSFRDGHICCQMSFRRLQYWQRWTRLRLKQRQLKSNSLEFCYSQSTSSSQTK